MSLFKQLLIWAGVGSGHAVLLVAAWGSGSEPRARPDGWIQVNLLAPIECSSVVTSPPPTFVEAKDVSLSSQSSSVAVVARPSAPSSLPATVPSAEVSPGNEINPPQFHFRAEPIYPRTARLAGVEGKVSLRLEISREGTLHRATVILSSGNVDLDRAAMEAAQNSTFYPATGTNGPLEASAEATYRFILRS